MADGMAAIHELCGKPSTECTCTIYDMSVDQANRIATLEARVEALEGALEGVPHEYKCGVWDDGGSCDCYRKVALGVLASRCLTCKGNGRVEMLEHCPDCDGSGFVQADTPAKEGE